MEPLPEVEDILFREWGQANYLPLSKEQVISLGKDPDIAVRFPNEIFGLGDEAYMGQMELVHQISCLDQLRRAAFSTYPGFEHPQHRAGDTYLCVHLRHCTDTLFQALTCSVWTELLTIMRMEDFRVWHDASTNHRCREWEAVLRWGKARFVSPEKIKAFRDATPLRDRYVWPAPWPGHTDEETGHRLDPSFHFSHMGSVKGGHEG